VCSTCKMEAIRWSTARRHVPVLFMVIAVRTSKPNIYVHEVLTCRGLVWRGRRVYGEQRWRSTPATCVCKILDKNRQMPNLETMCALHNTERYLVYSVLFEVTVYANLMLNVRARSRYSDGLRAGRSGFDSREEQKIILHSVQIRHSVSHTKTCGYCCLGK
jgi:hypothetical protein